MPRKVIKRRWQGPQAAGGPSSLQPALLELFLLGDRRKAAAALDAAGAADVATQLWDGRAMVALYGEHRRAVLREAKRRGIDVWAEDNLVLVTSRPGAVVFPPDDPRDPRDVLREREEPEYMGDDAA